MRQTELFWRSEQPLATLHLHRQDVLQRERERMQKMRKQYSQREIFTIRSMQFSVHGLASSISAQVRSEKDGSVKLEPIRNILGILILNLGISGL